MRSAPRFATCVLIMLSACKIPSADELPPLENPPLPILTDSFGGTEDANKAEVDKGGKAVDINPRVPVDTDMPFTAPAELWRDGAKRFSAIQSLPLCDGQAADPAACEDELVYAFDKTSFVLSLNACSCGVQKSKTLKLKAEQSKQLEGLILAIKTVLGPDGACVNDDRARSEIILQGAGGLEQSFPVAGTNCSDLSLGKVDKKSYIALLEFLRQTLPQ